MRLAIVTVSYHGEEHLSKLLKSLDQQTDHDFGHFVINNSPDDIETIRELTSIYPSTHYIANPANTGFAAGSNIGIRLAIEQGSDWVLLLNPDTLVESDFIFKLKQGLINKTGLVGLPVKEPGGITWGGTLEWLKTSLRHKHKLSTSDLYINGGAMAISRSAIQRIGFLDEAYFLYFEDVDYSIRARQEGLPANYTEQPMISHAVSTSTKNLGDPMLFRYHVRNSLYLNFRHAPFEIKLLIPFWSFWLMIKQIIKLAAGRNREISIAILQGVLDFHLGHMGKLHDEQEVGKRKIRLGIECENLEDGQSRFGVGHLVLNLLEEYVKEPAWREKYELYLYFKSAIPADPVLQDPIFKKRVLNTGSFNIFYHILLPIRAMVDRLDSMFFPAYMLPPLYIGRSIVLLTNDVYYEYKHGSLPLRYRLAYGLFTNWAALFADKILAISEESKKEVSKLYNIAADRIFVSHLGAKNKADNVGPNKYSDYILYVGQMFPRRNAYETLLAFEKIAKELPELKLILVGKDKYQPARMSREVKRINTLLGEERVIYHEYIARDEDIASLYTHAKLVVYVSSHEAFGLPPIEAAGYGTPVVVKDTALCHELLNDAAFFVKDPKDIEQFAAVLKDGITNEARRRDMIDKYKAIVPNFSWRKFAERFFKYVT